MPSTITAGWVRRASIRTSAPIPSRVVQAHDHRRQGRGELAEHGLEPEELRAAVRVVQHRRHLGSRCRATPKRNPSCLDLLTREAAGRLLDMLGKLQKRWSTKAMDGWEKVFGFV